MKKLWNKIKWALNRLAQLGVLACCVYMAYVYRDWWLDACNRAGICPTVIREIHSDPIIKTKFGIKRYSQSEIEELLYKYADEYDLNPVLVFAIAKTESHFQQMRRSENPHVFQRIKAGKAKLPPEWKEELQDDAGKHMASGAIGVMQVMPETAWLTARKLNIELPSMLELFDAEKNIKIGCAYLKLCVQEARGSFDKVAVCYNGREHVASGWSDSVKANILTSVVTNKGA